MDLYPHQITALNKLDNGKILWGGVGTGKSRVAVEYYKLREAPRDVYVITTAKKRDSFDWHEEFYRVGIGPKSGPVRPTQNKQSPQSRSDQLGASKEIDGSASGGEVRSICARTGSGCSCASSRADAGESESCDDRSTTGARKVLEYSSDVRKRRHQLEQGAGVGGDACGGGSVGCGVCEHDGSTGNLGGRCDERANPAGHCAERDRRGLVCAQAVLSEGDRDGTHCGGCRDGLVEGASERQGSGSFGDRKSCDRRGDETSTQYPYSLTVDSWNNIAKYGDTEGAFFIFDEQRLVGSGDWTRKFLRIAKRNRWILLSGTPGDTWMDYIPVFVANGFYKNRTRFKDEHVKYNTFTKFPKVDRYVNVGRLVRLRAQLLVEMPYVRHTRRRHVEVNLPYDKDALDLVLTKRWHVFEDRPLRDVGEMFLVMRRVVNSDPSRLEMVCELWKNHPKLIVFYNFNYELESLRSLKEYYDLGLMRNTLNQKTPSGLEIPKTPGSIKTIEINNRLISTSSEVAEWKVNDNGLLSPSTSNSSLTMVGSLHPSEKNTSSLSVESLERFSASDCNKKSAIALSPTSSNFILPGSQTTAISEWNGHRHEPIPQTDRWLYLVQYTAGAEGWNCTETDAMVMYSRNYSWKVTEQAYGRIDRLNTPFTDLWYYDFTSNSMIDKAIGRALKAKESFNEAKFKRLFK